MIQKRKDPYPKTFANACRVLAGWKNRYCGIDNCVYDVNYGIAFATTHTEDSKTTIRKRKLHDTKARKQAITQINVTKK